MRVVRPRERHRVALVAYRYLSENLRKPITIAHLCEVTGANERTLQRGFIETYGSTLKAQLTALRLERARRELLQRSAGTTVTKTATNWGFFHLGRFATKYQQMFGETPSQTLYG